MNPSLDRPDGDNSGLEQLAQDFREAMRRAVYLVRRLDADGELATTQLSTLKMLGTEGLRVGDIARNLGVKVPSATEQIIKLERLGLAIRRPDPDDSRAVRVVITDDGLAAVAAADRRRNAKLAGALSKLSDVERARLADALPVITRIGGALGPE
ncbi:MarR family winged helix-turn-helix transcriptional regulator [Arthrobacter sp. M4]|uniref:MarR family winged helix-turn-helix transcriptional regulator n=1 Tax=Arthrobacter sp. M4 TaxID=218160 RepID=UPI001CDC78D1|nr:MarR family transcriptional regulator [Arthrobacter sp. M4]MCA4134889.1 MarR family transcriptional regulator [Arthrobacter sp. M4]